MAISSTAIMSQSVLFLRDLIIANVTDPIPSRATNEKLCYTSYPDRPVTYPIITVKCENMNQNIRMGMRAEADYNELNFEIRVWALNEKQKDTMTDDVYTVLRQKQFDSGDGTIDNELFGFSLLSIENIDEKGPTGIKSKAMRIKYNAFGLG